MMATKEQVVDSEKVKWVLNNPCVGITKSDSLRMASTFGMLTAAFYIFHGGFLCATNNINDADVIFGCIYIFSGLSFSFLSYLLWVAVNDETLNKYKIWIGSNIILLALTLFTTFSRSVTKNMVIASALVWILCGAFLQCYMIWVVWTFLKTLQSGSEDPEEIPKNKAFDTRV